MRPRPSVLVLLLAGGCVTEVHPPPNPPPTVQAIFNPLPSPTPDNPSPAPQVPTPNDLALRNGHLNVPDTPGESPAQMDLNAYLDTLDGYPSTTTASASFSGPLSGGSVTIGTPTTAGAILVFDATGMKPLGPTDYTAALSADGMTITLTPTKRWTAGSQFVVVMFGGMDPAGLKGANGQMVVASPAFFFLRSPVPLLGRCGDGTQPGCDCPDAVVASMNPTDNTCHAVVQGVTDQQARMLEAGRRQLDSALSQLLPFAGPGNNNGGRSRSDVVQLWNFTISSEPMVVFDPTRGDVPFPNDVLINQQTGLVNLPIKAGDPMAPIYMGLNQLDGFSTTAPASFLVDATSPIDGASLLPGMTVQMLNVSGSRQPEIQAAPVYVNMGKDFAGQVAIQPIEALDSDQTRYAVIVTTDVKDKNGKNLQPPPLQVLLRDPNPLVDANGHSTVSLLDDASAAQLEVLRKAEAPLFVTLEKVFMLPRSKIAAAWTFTTQSIMRPLLALDAYPAQANLPTDVAITHIADRPAIASAAASLPYATSHLGAVVFGVFTTSVVAAPTISFSRTSTTPSPVPQADVFQVATPSPIPQPVKFTLTVPVTAGPWPVAIVQHGLTSWRGEVISIADAFAAQGWATISFDLIYHGARSACTDDTQCNGTCNKATGVCSGGLKLATASSSDPLACSLAPLSGDPTDCKPLASGAAFTNLTNLFASRDNLRQYVVDAAQVIRVLSDTTNGAGLFHQLIAPGLASYDPTHLAFIGQSLGGIDGTLFLSVTPQPTVGVLNVTGGHDLDALDSGFFHTIIDQFLAAIGVMRDTAAFNQIHMVVTWILDPGDPFAVGRHLIRDPVTSYLTKTKNAPKVLIQQEAGMDTTIADVFQETLWSEIFGPGALDANGHNQGKTTGGTTVSTFFPTALHDSLLIPVPDQTVMTSEQTQAVTWIATSGATLTSP